MATKFIDIPDIKKVFYDAVISIKQDINIQLSYVMQVIDNYFLDFCLIIGTVCGLVKVFKLLSSIKKEQLHLQKSLQSMRRQIQLDRTTNICRMIQIEKSHRDILSRLESQKQSQTVVQSRIAKIQESLRVIQGQKQSLRNQELIESNELVSSSITSVQTTSNKMQPISRPPISSEELANLEYELNFYPQNSMYHQIHTNLIKAARNNDQDNTQEIDFSELKKKMEKSFEFTQQIEKLFDRYDDGKTSSFDFLSSIKQTLQIINFPKFRRLITKNQEVKFRLSGKDIVLFIGSTGSGKTTNILKFLDYKLEIGKQLGLKTLSVAQHIKKEHVDLKMSPQSKSCTQNLCLAKVPSSMYKRGTLESHMRTYLCDTPGFNDSNGVQVDLANGVSMIDALSQCSSVRIVLILSQSDILSKKSEGIVEIGNTLNNLFTDFAKVEQCVEVYFNKIAEKNIQEIPKLIENKMQNLMNQAIFNNKLEKILQLLLTKSKKIENYLFPLKTGNAYQNRFQNLQKMERISDIKQNLRYSFSEKTSRKLDSYITKEKEKMKQYFGRMDYELAFYHFSILQELATIFKTNWKLNTVLQQLKELVLKVHQESIEGIAKIVKEIMNQNISFEISLNAIMKEKELLNKLRKHFKSILFVRNESITISLKQCETIIFSFLQSADNSNFKTITNALEIYSKHFYRNIYQDIYQQYQNNTKAIINAKIQFYLELMNEGFLTQSYSEMKIPNQKLLIYLNVQELMLNNANSNFRIQYNRLIAEIKIRQNNYINKVEQLGKGGRLSSIFEEQVQCARLAIQKLTGIQQLLPSQQQNLRSRIQSILNRLLEKCLDILVAIQNESHGDHHHHPVLNRSFLNNFKEMKSCLNLLMRISYIQQNLKSFFQQSMKIVRSNIVHNYSYLLQEFSILQELNQNDKIQVILNKMKKAFESLNIISSISNSNDDEQSISIEISSHFRRYLQQLKKQISLVKFNQYIQDQKCNIKLKDLNAKIKLILPMKRYSPLLQNEINQVVLLFAEKLQDPFKILTQIIPERQSEGKIINFLLKLDKIAHYWQDINHTIDEMFIEKVTPLENEMKQKLNTFYQIFSQKILVFLGYNLQNDLTDEIIINKFCQQVIQPIISLSSHKNIKSCLMREFCYESTQELNQIKKKIHEFYGDLVNKIQLSKNDPLGKVSRKMYFTISCQIMKIQNKIEPNHRDRHYEQLVHDLKMYSSHELKNELSQFFTNSQLREMAEINFEEMRILYQACIKSKNMEAKISIMHFICKKQNQIHRSIRSFKQELQSVGKIKTIKQKRKFLQCVQNILIAKRNLTTIYEENDKVRFILFRQADLDQICRQWSIIFLADYDQIKQDLLALKIIGLKPKIQLFGQYQSIGKQFQNNLQNIFCSSQVIKLLLDSLQYREYKRQLSQIMSQFSSSSLSSKQQANLPLKEHFLKLYLTIKQIISQYEKDIPEFKMDRHFIKYYESFEISCPKGKVALEKLNSKIYHFFDFLFEQLIKNYKIPYGKEVQNIILTNITYLPLNLQIQIKQQLQKSQIKINEEQSKQSKMQQKTREERDFSS